jgi:peptidoglycan hydrolase-like protein with peptidoglycan-binding domain
MARGPEVAAQTATVGICGTNTENALSQVQDQLNIGVDGKYGPHTARAMNHKAMNHEGVSPDGYGRISFG